MMELSEYNQFKISVNDRHNWRSFKPYLQDPTVIKALEYMGDFPGGNRELPIYKVQFYLNGDLHGLLISSDRFSTGTIVERIAKDTGVFVRYSHIFEEQDKWNYINPDRVA